MLATCGTRSSTFGAERVAATEGHDRRPTDRIAKFTADEEGIRVMRGCLVSILMAAVLWLCAAMLLYAMVSS